MTKRKLQILPEVLPDPRASKPTGPSPRERTTRRMRQLLSIAAAGALSAPGCGGTNGYMVVDMMPEPACPQGPQGLSVRAKWDHTDRDVISVEIFATDPSGIVFPAEALPAVDEGELVTWSIAEKSLLLVVAPNGVGSISVTADAHCAGVPAKVFVSLFHQGPGTEIDAQLYSR